MRLSDNRPGLKGTYAEMCMLVNDGNKSTKTTANNSYIGSYIVLLLIKVGKMR